SPGVADLLANARVVLNPPTAVRDAFIADGQEGLLREYQKKLTDSITGLSKETFYSTNRVSMNLLALRLKDIVEGAPAGRVPLADVNLAVDADVVASRGRAVVAADLRADDAKNSIETHLDARIDKDFIFQSVFGSPDFSTVHTVARVEELMKLTGLTLSSDVTGYLLRDRTALSAKLREITAFTEPVNIIKQYEALSNALEDVLTAYRDDRSPEVSFNDSFNLALENVESNTSLIDALTAASTRSPEFASEVDDLKHTVDGLLPRGLPADSKRAINGMIKSVAEARLASEDVEDVKLEVVKRVKRRLLIERAKGGESFLSLFADAREEGSTGMRNFSRDLHAEPGVTDAHIDASLEASLTGTSFSTAYDDFHRAGFYGNKTEFLSWLWRDEAVLQDVADPMGLTGLGKAMFEKEVVLEGGGLPVARLSPEKRAEVKAKVTETLRSFGDVGAKLDSLFIAKPFDPSEAEKKSSLAEWNSTTSNTLLRHLRSSFPAGLTASLKTELEARVTPLIDGFLSGVTFAESQAFDLADAKNQVENMLGLQVEEHRSGLVADVMSSLTPTLKDVVKDEKRSSLREGYTPGKFDELIGEAYNELNADVTEFTDTGAGSLTSHGKFDEHAFKARVKEALAEKVDEALAAIVPAPEPVVHEPTIEESLAEEVAEEINV
ncbi:MAG: hypothetical protein GOV15_01305, partial [Candidatus Diapherotrites archaeon]|nr:hypothetical protein [Candidatus Diapherotrites archaeon]